MLDAGSFTGAASTLGLSQPAVSQHIRRLEDLTGQKLLTRDTHHLAVTASGAVLERFARGVVELDDQAMQFYAGMEPRSRVRLGVAEDFAITGLPSLLRKLAVAQPTMEIDLTVGLTSLLYPELDGGRLDLVLAKRPTGDDRGVVIRRDPLIWLAHRDFQFKPNQTVPLIAYPGASITTRSAMVALESAGMPWRLACSAQTLTGILSGLRAGLGLAAQSRTLLEAFNDLRDFSSDHGLPPLPEVELVLLARSSQPSGHIGEAFVSIETTAKTLWTQSTRMIVA